MAGLSLGHWAALIAGGGVNSSKIVLAIGEGVRKAVPAMSQRRNRPSSLGELFSVGLLVTSLLAASLLSVSPQLHERLHADCTTRGHHCVITLFASAQCGDTTAAPVSAAPEIPSVNGVPLSSQIFSLPATRVSSILEHAPPALA